MSSIQQPDIRNSQNFLKSRSLVSHILDKCDIRRDDIVYEIGPGKGMLTDELAQRCCQVIAVEKDTVLASRLCATYAHAANVRIYEGDFLTYNLPHQHYKVVGNIPFNITTAIVTHLTTAPVPPDDTYLVMQKEAAQRFLGIPRETLYSVLLKPNFELELLHSFRRSDFTPAPRVDVVMLRLRKRGPPLIAHNDRALFRDFIVYSFTTPQPCLKKTFNGIFTPRQLSILSRHLHVNFDVTPTALRFEQWLHLFDAFKLLATPQTIHTVRGSEIRLRHQQAKLEKIHRTRSL